MVAYATFNGLRLDMLFPVIRIAIRFYDTKIVGKKAEK